jgi:hypothetical protein
MLVQVVEFTFPLYSVVSQSLAKAKLVEKVTAFNMLARGTDDP